MELVILLAIAFGFSHLYSPQLPAPPRRHLTTSSQQSPHDLSLYHDTESSIHLTENTALLQQNTLTVAMTLFNLTMVNNFQSPILLRRHCHSVHLVFVFNNVYVVRSMHKNLISITHIFNDNVFLFLMLITLYTFDLDNSSLLCLVQYEVGLYMSLAILPC